MSDKKNAIGLFFVDASFDHKTKTSTIGAVNISTGKNYSWVIKAKTPQEAEEIGLEMCIKTSLEDKIFNVLLFSDNKYAVSNTIKMLRQKDLFKKFWKIQIVWIPREFNQLADLLSKNVSENDAKALNELKINSLNNRSAALSEKMTKVYVKDIKQDDFISNDIIYRVKQVKALYGVYNSSNKPNSKILQMIICDEPKFKDIELSFMEPDLINDFENEIKLINKKDLFLGKILESLRDLFMFL